MHFANCGQYTADQEQLKELGFQAASTPHREAAIRSQHHGRDSDKERAHARWQLKPAESDHDRDDGKSEQDEKWVCRDMWSNPQDLTGREDQNPQEVRISLDPLESGIENQSMPLRQIPRIV